MTKNSPKDINKLDDKTFIITYTIPQADIAKEYQHALSHLASDVEIKGFRKGKAPLDVVEAQIDPNKIYEHVAEHLLSGLYSAKIKEHDLKPIIQPQVKILNPPVSQDKDWQVEITACELPEVNLGKYQEEIKKINASNIIKAEGDQQEHLNKILDILLTTVKVTLPEILISADLQNRLTQMIDQISQAGLTLAQYLKSKNTTIEKLQDELKAQISKEWTLNLSIDKIAETEKIEVDQKEIEGLVSKNPQASSNVNMLYYVMRQQKVLEFLQKLK